MGKSPGSIKGQVNSEIKRSKQTRVPVPKANPSPTLLMAVRAGSQAASRSCTNSWMLLEITLQKKTKIKQEFETSAQQHSTRTGGFDCESRKITSKLTVALCCECTPIKLVRNRTREVLHAVCSSGSCTNSFSVETTFL